MSSDFTTYAAVGLPVFGLSLAGTWGVRAAANHFGWVERPRPDRWHTAPRAKLGGIAIHAALMAGLALFAPPTRQVVALAALATFMFGVGLVDDLREVRPQTKLVAQISAGLLVFAAGFHFNPSMPYWVDFAFVVLWVVGITNAMNLLDNMDGLSAGIAIIAGSFRLLLYHADGNEAGALLSVIFLAAVAGFLVFNYSPASVFMGDCGAFLIGFFLAAINLTTAQTYAKSLLSILFFPLLILAIPIFDTTFVSLMRWVSGRRVSQGGRDHTSHRLVAVGLSERQAVLILYALSCASGVVAYVLYRVGFSYGILAVALAVLGISLFGIYLSTVSVYPEDSVPAELVARRPAFMLARGPASSPSIVLWVLIDVTIISLAYYVGYLIRFRSTGEWLVQFQLFARTCPFIVVSMLVGLSTRGLYQRPWERFGLTGLGIILSGSLFGMSIAVLGLTYGARFEGYSRSVFVIAWAVGVTGLGGARLFIRWLSAATKKEAQQRVLIYGGGSEGGRALAAIRQSGTQVPVGFVADRTGAHRAAVDGVPVLGESESLEFIARKHRAGALLVAAANLDAVERQMVADVAERLRIPVSWRASEAASPIGRAG